jgi:hypothetical protein
MENRHGLCVDLRIAEASGHAERDQAMEMLRRLRRRGYQPGTMGADKGCDAGRFPYELLGLGIEPHIAVNEHVSRTSPARRLVKRRGTKSASASGKASRRSSGGAEHRQPETDAVQRAEADMDAGYLVATAYDLSGIGRLTAEAAR